MNILLFQLGEKIPRVIAILIWVGVLLYAIWACVEMAFLDPIGGAFNILKIAVLWAIVALLGMFLFLHDVATRIVDEAFGGRKFLKEEGRILSDYHAAIASGEGERVREELETMFAENNADSEIALLLQQIYWDRNRNANVALLRLETYFAAQRAASLEGLELVMRYADLLRELGRKTDAIPLLEREAQSNIYQSPDQRAIHIRLQSLKEG